MTTLNAENLQLMASHARIHGEHLALEIVQAEKQLRELDGRLRLLRDQLRSAERIAVEANCLRETILDPVKATADLMPQ